MSLHPIPEGTYFHAQAHPDLQQTRPQIAFVPKALIRPDGTLDMDKYQAQRWHTINAGANHHAIGSHIFPDMTQPANEASALVTEIKISLRRFLQKTAGKESKPRRPGKLGQADEMELS